MAEESAVSLPLSDAVPGAPKLADTLGNSSYVSLKF
jgi:hypothetical protein